MPQEISDELVVVVHEKTQFVCPTCNEITLVSDLLFEEDVADQCPHCENLIDWKSLIQLLTHEAPGNH